MSQEYGPEARSSALPERRDGVQNIISLLCHFLLTIARAGQAPYATPARFWLQDI